MLQLSDLLGVERTRHELESQLLEVVSVPEPLEVIDGTVTDPLLFHLSATFVQPRVVLGLDSKDTYKATSCLSESDVLYDSEFRALALFLFCARSVCVGSSTSENHTTFCFFRC